MRHLFYRVETIEFQSATTVQSAQRQFEEFGDNKVEGIEILSVDYYHHRKCLSQVLCSEGLYTLKELDLVIIYWTIRDHENSERMKAVHGMRDATISGLMTACSEDTGSDPSDIQIHKIVL